MLTRHYDSFRRILIGLETRDRKVALAKVERQITPARFEEGAIMKASDCGGLVISMMAPQLNQCPGLWRHRPDKYDLSKRKWCFLLLATAVLAAAQDSPPMVPTPQPDVIRLRNGVTAPRLLFKREPMYSEEARIAGLEGRILLSIVVAEDGTAQNPRVIRGLGLGLDEMAIEAVRGWRFQPGTKEEKPVRVAATVEVNFRLLPLIRWRLTGASFQLPAQGSRPVITEVEYPPITRQKASFTLSLEIDEAGVPQKLHLEKSSDEQLGSALTAAVQNWRFSPGLQDGKPFVVPCTLTFASGEGDFQTR
jgi:TonB family protein